MQSYDEGRQTHGPSADKGITWTKIVPAIIVYRSSIGRGRLKNTVSQIVDISR